MRRTAEDAARTRADIVDAALAAFAQHGWERATYADIAARTGVTRGAVHHHFPDKATLLTQALAQGWRTYGDRVFAAVDDEHLPDARTRVETVVATYLELLSTDELFRSLATTTVLVAPQALGPAGGNPAGTAAAAKADGLDHWHALLRRAVETGPTGPTTGPTAGPTAGIDPHRAAGLLLVVLQGLTVTAVTRPADLPRPPHHLTAAAALVGGVVPRGDQSRENPREHSRERP